MLRRVLAAIAAIILAVLAAVLIIRYANTADERAQEGLESRTVLVATEAVDAGTPATDLTELVEERQIPASGVGEGTLTDLEAVEGLVLDVDLVTGEPLLRSRFVAPDNQRAEGRAPLPEGTEDLNQVTLLLDKSRALGGNVAIGDRVGVFLSFDVQDDPATEESDPVKTTHLTLHKVPVVRVEGAYVGDPASAEAEERAEDQVFVTLALDASDAERLVFGMEWGSVYLSLEPDSADEDTDIVVMTYPTDIQSVYQ